jgi:hypothetical protein
MLKVGTIVSIVSTWYSLKGIVVEGQAGSDAGSHARSRVLVTTSGEYQGKTYPFTTHQLEIISEPS